MHLTTPHLQLITRTTSDGVVDQGFTVGDVPGVLWSPEHPTPGAPLPLMGHGGGLHKGAPGLVARAGAAVRKDGFHVAAIDAPGHGDRPRTEEDRRRVDALRDARTQGAPLRPL